ncbi:MAG: hypothetical protein AAF211_28645, partial [Myxococcota bacterium]
MLEASLRDAGSLEEVLDGLRTAAAQWWGLHEAEPSFRPLLHAILGDPVLQRANLDDSERSATILAAALRPWVPHVEGELSRMLLVINHLFVPALQLALAQPTDHEQRATWETWIGLSERAILALVEPG